MRRIKIFVCLFLHSLQAANNATDDFYGGKPFSTKSALTAKAFVLINADLGAEQDILNQIKSVPNVAEVHVVYGVYDIVVKVEAESLDKVKDTVTHRLRTLEKVRSTLTMIVVEG